MAKSGEIDVDLAAALKQAKNRRMYFAFVVKGGTDGALLVSKQKIPPTAIAEAKKKCGGSTVIKGACFGEEGKLVFETAKEPPATLGNAIKLVARRDTGLTIAPLCRVGTAPDLADEEPAEHDSAAKPASAKSSAPADAKSESAWKQKLAGITPSLKNVLAQKNELAARIKAEFGAAQALANEGKFADGVAALDKIAAAIAGGGAQVVAQQHPADPAALWRQKLAKFTPELKAALAAGGDSATRAKAEFAAAQSLVPKDYPAAIAKLDRLAASLQKSPDAEAPSEDSDLAPADRRADLVGRLNALSGDLKGAITGKSPQAAELKMQFGKVSGLLKSDVKDFDEAESELDALEDLLADADLAALQAQTPNGSPVVPIWQTGAIRSASNWPRSKAGWRSPRSPACPNLEVRSQRNHQEAASRLASRLDELRRRARPQKRGRPSQTSDAGGNVPDVRQHRPGSRITRQQPVRRLGDREDDAWQSAEQNFLGRRELIASTPPIKVFPCPIR